MSDNGRLFEGFSDRFNGITVDSLKEYDANYNFEDKLKSKLRKMVTNTEKCFFFCCRYFSFLDRKQETRNMA